MVAMVPSARGWNGVCTRPSHHGKWRGCQTSQNIGLYAGLWLWRRQKYRPLKRSIEGMRPANGVVRESIWASPVIYMIHHLGSSTNNAIQRHHLIVRPFRPAFCARSVITYNVNEHGIMELAHVA